MICLFKKVFSRSFIAKKQVWVFKHLENWNLGSPCMVAQAVKCATPGGAIQIIRQTVQYTTCAAMHINLTIIENVGEPWKPFGEGSGGVRAGATWIVRPDSHAYSFLSLGWPPPFWRLWPKFSRSLIPLVFLRLQGRTICQGPQSLPWPVQLKVLCNHLAAKKARRRDPTMPLIFAPILMEAEVVSTRGEVEGNEL